MVASARHRWFALALLSVVQFMLVLDIAVVNVALPSIQVDLGFSQENLQWVISAYALVFGGFLLLGGRLVNLKRRRRCSARDVSATSPSVRGAPWAVWVPLPAFSSAAFWSTSCRGNGSSSSTS